VEYKGVGVGVKCKYKLRGVEGRSRVLWNISEVSRV
jgi:hypothetical protein